MGGRCPLSSVFSFSFFSVLSPSPQTCRVSFWSEGHLLALGSGSLQGVSARRDPSPIPGGVTERKGSSVRVAPVPSRPTTLCAPLCARPLAQNPGHKSPQGAHCYAGSDSEGSAQLGKATLD